MAHDVAEFTLALSYAPPSARAGIAALFALDDTLAAIVRSTRETIVGQMRLTWWYEALVKLDSAPPPAEPVLRAVSAEVVPAGVRGADLALMTEGWEALLAPVLDSDAIERFSLERGARLFVAAGRLLGTDDQRIAVAGQGWALADLLQRLGDAAGRTLARVRAAELLDQALVGRWPKQARALGAMAVSARFDVSADQPPPGSPKRVGRMLLHRLTGY
jgi:phytoene synthase